MLRQDIGGRSLREIVFNQLNMCVDKKLVLNPDNLFIKLL